MDVGIYCLNASRYLTGEEPREIKAYSSVIDRDGRFNTVEENVTWTMKFPSGIVASCNTTYGANMEGFYRVHGSKGWLQVDSAFVYEGLRLDKLARPGRLPGREGVITMKRAFLLLLVFALPVVGVATVQAQSEAQLEGLWEGYDGEWGHVSRQLIALAEAIPADKYSWRPAPGVRSVSEVFMHITIANFWLLSITGPKMPPDLKQEMEKTVTKKADVIAWLKRSLDAVRTARAQLKPGDLERKVKVDGKTVTVDGMYLRIIVHANEHMGQLVAYARMNGIVPPWSK